MIALIVYGSFINKQELKDKNISTDRCVPIVLNGFKREFSQEPSWRKATSKHRAVLTCFTDPNHFINALLIKDISKEELKELDVREIGYDRLQIDINQIQYKYTNEHKDLDEIYIYIGKEEKYNNGIFPNKNYLQLCIDGANTWSREFANDFMNTTFSKNKTLKDLYGY